VNNSSLIKASLISLMDSDPSVRLFCEGIKDSFYQTIPLASEILRPTQLEELPISEAAAIGLVTGAAMFGIRPIICFQRVEFALLAMDQLVTNASKTKYLSGGKLTSPFLLRLVIGRGWGQGPCHSQSFEPLWHSIPGLRVYMPACSSDYTDVFNKFEVSDSPIITLEHRWTHGISVETSIGCKYSAPEVTIFCYSYNSILASRVSRLLAQYGVDVDVVNSSDFSSAVETVRESVIASGRLVAMDLGPSFLGLSSELIAQLVEQGIVFKAMPVRIGTPFEPASACPEKAYVHFPNAFDLFDALEGLIPHLREQIMDARAAFQNACKGQHSDVPGDYFRGPF